MEGMLSVFLVDDHSVFRSGVRAELSQAVNIVGEAGGVTEAIAGICTTHPDVVLLDVHMPDGGGQAVIQGVDTPTTFLALSVSDAAEDVISVIRAGARGYVTKTISGPELIDAVRRVHDGDAVFSPRLAGFVLDAFCAPDKHVGVGVVGGAGTWLFGGVGTNHIGASGLIYGWLGYLGIRGFANRSVWQIVMGLFLAFSYSGLIWGVLPTDTGVSWQGHLFGGIGGVLAGMVITSDDPPETQQRRAQGLTGR